MKLLIQKGKTSFFVDVFIQNNSVTTGAGLTGLTSGSAGLVCYRARQDDGNAGGTQITLSGGTRGTWSSGGFVEKDSTNMPGIYELGLPNTALATGSDFVVVYLFGATNMAPCVLEIQLIAPDPDNANWGMTNVSSNVVQWNGSNVSAPATAGVPDINVKNFNNAAAGSLPTNFSSLSITAAGLTSITSNIKKNTASSAFEFLMTDSMAHTPKTGLTVTSQVSIDGGAFGATVNSVVEISNGSYKLDLAAADVNGNHIMLMFTAAGADQLNVEIITQP